MKANALCGMYTNVATPYRIPLWHALKDRVSLQVHLAATEESKRGWGELVWAQGSIRIETYLLPKVQIGEMFLYLPTISWLRAKNENVVVISGWESPANLALYVSAKFRAQRVVLFYESTRLSHRFKRGLAAGIRTRVFRGADAIVTPGIAATQAVVEMGVPRERIFEGFNAIDNTIFTPTSSSHHAGHYFGYVGQLIERKNVAAAIKGFSQMRRDEDLLFIVGSGPEADSLRGLVKELGLSEAVIFLGPIENSRLPGFYNSIETLILPSHKEVWGLVVNESLNAGCHVVVSRECGVTPNVANMRGVFVAESNDSSLSVAMNDSRNAWTGRILNPEIKDHDVHSFAAKFIDAIDFALKPRLLWVTNIPSTYRLKVWEEISKQSRLQVGLLATTERNRFLTLPAQSRFGLINLNARRVRNGENNFYFPNTRLIKSLQHGQDGLIVSGWDSPAQLTALAYAKFRGIKIVLHYGSTLDSHKWRRGPIAYLRRKLVSSFDHVVTYGTAATEAVISMGVDMTKVSTGFNSVDVDEIHRKTFNMRHQLPPQRRNHEFLYVGQLIERKNVEALLQAFATVDTFREDRLWIVGEGHLRNYLQEFCEQLGISEKVQFTGNLQGDALLRRYASAQTCVLPSTTEVWGLVANEGLAAGCHVVLSPTAGASRDLKDMKGVFVAKGTSAREIGEAMLESRSAWMGWNDAPEILDYGPEVLADLVLRALDL